MKRSLNKLLLGAGLAATAFVLAVAWLFLLRADALRSASVSAPTASADFANDIASEATQAVEVELPSFVYNSALSLQAYKLALSQPEILSPIPCYCDCGRASQHKNLKDCFFKDGGELNDHASNCDVCQDEIIDVNRWRAEGKSQREIRDSIDAKYRDYGEPTDTPFE